MRPEPAAAITAASAATEALDHLGRAGIPPGIPLAACARLTRLLYETARLLASALHTEAMLAEAVLMLTPGTAGGASLADDAARARTALTRAANLTGAAADHLRQAWREAMSAGMPADIAGPDAGAVIIRRARQASHRGAELADALTAAGRRDGGGTPALALLTGHWQVTEALASSVASLAGTCAMLRAPLADAGSQLRPQHRARAHRAASSLDEAAAQLRPAWRRAAGARDALARGRALHQLAATAGAVS
jgi:hypothetical protein